MDMTLEDCVIKITDAEAVESARLLEHQSISDGFSSSAALAALQKLIACGAKGTILSPFPDCGDRYFNKKPVCLR